MTMDTSFFYRNYLTRAQVAQLFPLSIRFLERVAAGKVSGPPSIRLPNMRCYLYRRIDIIAYLDSHLACNSNSPVRRGRPTLAEKSLRRQRERLLNEAKLRTGDGRLQAPKTEKRPPKSRR